jgi:DNA-binding NarL/FixJ family response regulator
MVTVLIVENNQIYRDVMKAEILGRCPSVRVEEALTGEVALKKIKALCPQVVFMDIGLPDENGLRLTQRVKAENPAMGVAIITGHDFPEYRQAAAQSGADRYFVKDSVKWDEVAAFIGSAGNPQDIVDDSEGSHSDGALRA